MSPLLALEVVPELVWAELVCAELVVPELVLAALVFAELVLVVVVVGVAAVLAVVAVDPLEATVVPAVVDVLASLRAASAGSWPETSITAISSQVAMNSETAPAATRRLIARVRAARA